MPTSPNASTMREPPLGEWIKGLPEAGMGIGLGEIGRQQWNVLHEDVPLPAAIIRQSALENNRRWMSDFLERTHVRLAPHGKTTMSPQLFRLQMADGAWGLTLATTQQIRVARSAGIRRIILANQLVGKQDIAYIVGESCRDPSLEIYCFVDSGEGVRRLSMAARSLPNPVPLRLLLELGHSGGRAGCRDSAAAVALAEAIRDCRPYVALQGIAGYEGLIRAESPAQSAAKVAEFLRFMVQVARELEARKLFDGSPTILTAGGSAYYDLAADVLGTAGLRNPTEVILRSGCYVTHDSGLYSAFFEALGERSAHARAIGGKPESALEIWAYVQSLPEPGRAILSAGRRDFGHDAGFPVPVKHFAIEARQLREIRQRAGIVAVNDQHAHLEHAPELTLCIGDMIGLGISHPCTTFDKWQLLYVVDDDYRICSAIRTFF